LTIPSSKFLMSANKMTELHGLTEQEAIARRSAGQGNTVKLKTSRSYLDILNENLFTFINGVFFAISALMISLQRYGDGFLVVGVIFGGVLINICQEIWAKRKLDQISLLHRPKAIVIREAKAHNIDPSALVLGDLVAVQAGDQIVVDGQIVGEGRIEVDESLLTGESDMIPKFAGQPVYSGSFCVSGNAFYEAQKVGAETLAYQLMAGARAFRQIYTPLQQEINLIIRIFMLIACFLWILLGISFFSRSYDLNEFVQRSAVVAGLVPVGLYLAITLAYGLGAVKMIGKDVLIQQANAVESLSNVNVLCLDKTGTLTTNQISLHSVYPIAISEEELRSRLGDYAASTTAGNKTSEAIALSCPGQAHTPVMEVPFSSGRKWSAIALDTPKRSGVYVLGAPEMLAKAVSFNDEMASHITARAEEGLRVVLFAYSSDVTALRTEGDRPELPSNLVPLGIISFSDVLRPEATETLAGFAKAGIEVKIISGDNPQTVLALAKQAGLGEAVKVVSGLALAEMNEAQFAQAAEVNTVFGRISPEQKAALVRSLRKSGHYVAMMGDGVNDVLSLKQANLGIAMESGSKATRGVADIVLLKDSFAVLPFAFLEGQRIRNGIQDILKLFMVKVFCVTLLIFSTGIIADTFPFQNKQSSIYALLGVGLPSICIPIWAKPSDVSNRSMVRSMLHFTISATLSTTLIALAVYLFYLVGEVLDLPPNFKADQLNYSVPRTALVTTLVLCQLLLIPFLKPPTTAWVGGERLNGDWRYSIVAFSLMVVYSGILFISPLRHFFELSAISVKDYAFIGLMSLAWCLIQRLMWRTKFLDQFLGVDLS
jgi:cation-transporting P-type ATPase E